MNNETAEQAATYAIEIMRLNAKLAAVASIVGEFDAEIGNRQASVAIVVHGSLASRFTNAQGARQ